MYANMQKITKQCASAIPDVIILASAVINAGKNVPANMTMKHVATIPVNFPASMEKSAERSVDSLVSRVKNNASLNVST